MNLRLVQSFGRQTQELSECVMVSFAAGCAQCRESTHGAGGQLLSKMMMQWTQLMRVSDCARSRPMERAALGVVLFREKEEKTTKTGKIDIMRICV